jgi:hypothetical protein
VTIFLKFKNYRSGWPNFAMHKGVSVDPNCASQPTDGAHQQMVKRRTLSSHTFTTWEKEITNLQVLQGWWWDFNSGIMDYRTGTGDSRSPGTMGATATF